MRERSTSSSQKLSRATGSTPEVGSSRIRICGSCSTATASESRWRRPIGSALGQRVEVRAQAEPLDQLVDARLRLVRRQVIEARVQDQVLADASARRRARTPASCSRGCLRTSMLPASTELPNSVAVPSVGGSRPVSIFMVVDLPQPFEPRKPKISPRSIDSVTWSTAVKVAEALRQAVRLDGDLRLAGRRAAG